MKARSLAPAALAALVVFVVCAGLGYIGQAKAQDNPLDPAGPAAAGTPAPGQDNPAADTPAPKKTPAKGVKDPVATAFTLPRGVTLNEKQQAAFEKLKAENEPALRQALDDLAQAEDAAAKTKAAKEARDIRAKIRAGIQGILTMPYQRGTDKSGSDSAGSAADGSYNSGDQPAYRPYGYGYRPRGYYYPPPYYNPYYSGYPGTGGSSTTTGTGGTTTSKPPTTTTTTDKGKYTTGTSKSGTTGGNSTGGSTTSKPPTTTTTSKPPTTTTSKPPTTTTSKPPARSTTKPKR